MIGYENEDYGLKPCPFCGLTKKLAVPGSVQNPDLPDQIRFSVYCLNCDAEGPYNKNKDVAVAKWNDRGATEKIPMLPMNDAEHFAIGAICDASKGKETIKTPFVGRGYLEVDFLVDGVRVPFAKTVQVMYQRFHQEVDRKAAELAYETMKLQGLDKVRDAIEHFDWEIREQISKAFNIDLSNY